MATLKELRDERLRKLEELKKLGVNPYPAHAERTHSLADITEKFGELEHQQVSVVGRIVNIRKFGKIAFIVIRDMSGMLQLFIPLDKMASMEKVELDGGAHWQPKPDIARASGEVSFVDLPLLDTGDFVQATGTVVKTQTGEISVEVSRLFLLTKSLRPLPTTHDGFTNKEERLRRRYVDMNVNQDVRDRFIRRSKFWQATRQYLIDHGFIEINVPVLEHTTGGADANPFVTHMDALDQDFYLRISHELPLKRLLGAGYEKVFDIGPRFRNENYSEEHLPEHVAMEWYWAYADWTQGMQFTQAFIRAIVDATWDKRQFKLANGQDIDLGEDDKDWPKISFVDIIRERYGLDVFTCTLDQAVAELKKIGGEVEKIDNRSRVLDKLWKKIRVELAGPAFLVDIPTFLQPLAKVNPSDRRLTEQFNLLLGGTEACKAYSELNDPVDQLNRFVEQQHMRDEGDDEAMMLDIDFVEMLEYGMPPACGYGHSERLFWMLEGVTAREGVVFPQLRREVDATTKALYPQVFSASAAEPAVRKQPQDFSRRIVTIVNKELEAWQAASAVGHMDAIIGSEIPKDRLTSGEYFVGKDGTAIPRNSQYPIIIMRADEKELHKIYEKVKAEHLKHHVFIKEMQETSNDDEIVQRLANQAIADTTFYGLSFFASNEKADELTRGLQLWK